MALQTQTYSSAKSEKAFTLTLILTENSVSDIDNTSNISYELVLKSGGWYFSQYSHGYNITLGGNVIAELVQVPYENQISIDQNSSLTIASGTTTITHNSSGDFDMPVSFSFFTDYTGTLSGSGTMSLTHIDCGFAYIGNGSSYDTYEVYIDNGISWDRYAPYIWNGTNWEICG